MIKRGLLKYVTKEIGGMDIWRFGTKPRNWTIEQVTRSVQRQTTISPTIASIMEESANKTLSP